MCANTLENPTIKSQWDEILNAHIIIIFKLCKVNKTVEYIYIKKKLPPYHNFFGVLLLFVLLSTRVSVSGKFVQSVWLLNLFSLVIYNKELFENAPPYMIIRPSLKGMVH